MRYLLWGVISTALCFLFKTSYGQDLNTNDYVTVRCKAFYGDTKEKAPNLKLILKMVSNDTTQKKMTTDEDGILNIKLKTNVKKFFVYSEFLKMYSDTISLDLKKTNIGDLWLNKRSLQLKEVIISGSEITGVASKKTYMIGELTTYGVPLVKAFIQEIPEITTIKGNFKAYGNKNITIYLNGKRINRDAVLKLPLSIIKKMELIADPSLLRSEDNDNMLLNIITKNSANAIIGSTSSASGSVISPEAGVVLEPYFLQNDLLVSVSFNTYFNKSRSALTSRWTTDVPTDLSSVDQDAKGNGIAKPIFTSLFAQKNLTKHLTFSTNFNYSRTNNRADKYFNNNVVYYNSPSQLQHEQIKDITDGHQVAVGSELAYNTKENNIFLNVGYVRSLSYENIEDSVYSSGFYIRTADNLQYYLSNEYSAQISLEHSYSKKFSQRIVASINDRKLNSAATNSVFTPSSLSSDQSSSVDLRTSYSAAMGFNFNSKLVNVSLSGKINFANSKNATGTYSKTESYTPQLYLTKDLKKAGNFNLSFSRNISIPNQVQLSNNLTQNNSYDISYGNNRLKQESTYKIDLTHDIPIFSNQKSKTYLNSDIFYSTTHDLIGSNGYNFDNVGMNFFTRFRNIGNASSIGLYSGLSHTFKKYGSIRLSGSFRLNSYDLKDSVKHTNAAVGVNSSWALNLSKKISTRVEFSYDNLSSNNYSYTTMHPSSSISATCQLLKDKIYIEAYWYDVFNLGGTSQINYNSYYVQRSTSRTVYGQSISATLTYIFGKTLNKSTSSQREIEKESVKAENRGERL